MFFPASNDYVKRKVSVNIRGGLRMLLMFRYCFQVKGWVRKQEFNVVIHEVSVGGNRQPRGGWGAT